jgi:hypothetical protein
MLLDDKRIERDHELAIGSEGCVAVWSFAGLAARQSGDVLSSPHELVGTWA